MYFTRQALATVNRAACVTLTMHCLTAINQLVKRKALTMAIKRVCDRCGAEINPCNSVTYAGMRRIKADANTEEYELCVSCAHKLRKWFNGEENDNG